MLETFVTRSNATPGRPGEACSLLALRAVAQSAGPVQQPAARSAAGRVPSALARFGGARETVSFSGDRSAMKVGPRMSNTERRLRRSRNQARKPKAGRHLLVVVAFVAASKTNSVCGFPSHRGSVFRVLANPSLNRTHCGGPSFGL